MIRMAKSISPSALGEAIAEQLHLYREEIIERVDAAGEKAIKKLVKLTRKTAPEKKGFFRKSITYKKHTTDHKECSAYEWGVKAPDYRRTHLLVNGHLAADGSRIPGDPFLENALDTVLPEYEADVEEALTE